jgi:hypothetical protein
LLGNSYHRKLKGLSSRSNKLLMDDGRIKKKPFERQEKWDAIKIKHPTTILEKIKKIDFQDHYVK